MPIEENADPFTPPAQVTWVKWAKFKSTKDQKEYETPQFLERINGKVAFYSATGYVQLPTGSTVTSLKLKYSVKQNPNVWVGPIELEGQYDFKLSIPPTNEWSLRWDPTAGTVVGDEVLNGSTVEVYWAADVKDANNLTTPYTLGKKEMVAKDR